jgi:hypothetical protein
MKYNDQRAFLSPFAAEQAAASSAILTAMVVVSDDRKYCLIVPWMLYLYVSSEIVREVKLIDVFLLGLLGSALL